MILTIGVIIALLPALGFQHSWESFFQILAGLSIVLLSVWAQIDKKLTLKAKAHQRQARKAIPEVPPVLPDTNPVYELPSEPETVRSEEEPQP